MATCCAPDPKLFEPTSCPKSNSWTECLRQTNVCSLSFPSFLPSFLPSVSPLFGNPTNSPHPTGGECDDGVNNALAGDNFLNSSKLLPNLIKNIKVLLYSGQFDMICNHLGTEKILATIEWNGKDRFLNSTRDVWEVNGRTGGYVKAHGNLQYLLVVGASHMVPLDQPDAALDMITRFLNGTSFADLPQFHGSLHSKMSRSNIATSNKEMSGWSWSLIIAGCSVASAVLALYAGYKLGHRPKNSINSAAYTKFSG